MRAWTVAGAVIEQDGGVLLVHNRRRGGRSDWSPPGGVIDEGETVLEGLTREVEEETGLVVRAWEGPVYEIVCEAPDLGWTLRVEAYRALEVAGDLRIEDPDGIVVDAAFVPVDACAGHLDGAQRWVVEPLVEFLAERWADARRYGYHVAGAELDALTVTRR